MENFAFVIEDDEDLSAIFVKALEAAGFKVEAIRDGEVAQKRLQETTPRVIVLDMHLPHRRLRPTQADPRESHLWQYKNYPGYS